MKPFALTTLTPGGGKLFAVVDPNAEPWRKGALAHSPTVASLAPFTSKDAALAAFARVGVDGGDVRPAEGAQL